MGGVRVLYSSLESSIFMKDMADDEVDALWPMLSQEGWMTGQPYPNYSHKNFRC
jgi:hypothetical protein